IRYTIGEEPVTVTAEHSTTRPEIYHEVDETTEFALEFPSGAIAHGKTSFGESLNHLKATCEKGWYELKPFQSYNGVKGRRSDGKLLDATIDNQQAKQMDDDALAIMQDKPMLVPGEEGMLDIRIVEAIYKAAASSTLVKL
ncbi:MAG: Gfo/Idh/MocA family oxidoreductase, partial [Saprospiraceae bacterium]|nr:Gfo/Idh/MocA family oxidoreductase [Saprospiraceae bacterium]